LKRQCIESGKVRTDQSFEVAKIGKGEGLDIGNDPLTRKLIMFRLMYAISEY